VGFKFSVSAIILANREALCTHTIFGQWRGKMIGIGFFELLILAAIPLLLVVVGVAAFIATRGPKK